MYKGYSVKLLDLEVFTARTYCDCLNIFSRASIVNLMLVHSGRGCGKVCVNNVNIIKLLKKIRYIVHRELIRILL